MLDHGGDWRAKAGTGRYGVKAMGAIGRDGRQRFGRQGGFWIDQVQLCRVWSVRTGVARHGAAGYESFRLGPAGGDCREA
jgi:hypothetical protein